MTSLRRIILLGCLALAVPTAALAQLAYTTTTVNMRAGPDPTYPLVLRVYPGTQVNVYRLPRQLELVRRRRRPGSGLGVRAVPDVSVPGTARADLRLRPHDRPADRHVHDRSVLGQLLPQPAVVEPAQLLVPAAAAVLPPAAAAELSPADVLSAARMEAGRRRRRRMADGRHRAEVAATPAAGRRAPPTAPAGGGRAAAADQADADAEARRAADERAARAPTPR